MAQAASCWSVTVEEVVHSEDSPRRISGKVAVGQVFYCQCYSTTVLYSLLRL